MRIMICDDNNIGGGKEKVGLVKKGCRVVNLTGDMGRELIRQHQVPDVIHYTTGLLAGTRKDRLKSVHTGIQRDRQRDRETKAMYSALPIPSGYDRMLLRVVAALDK